MTTENNPSDLQDQSTRVMPVREILEPQNPMRSNMNEEEFFALCDSFRAIGQLQPILIKVTPKGYEVVAGHRRLRAAKYLRWETILCTVVSGDSDMMDARKIHENNFREAIQPEDEGKYYEHLAIEKKMGIAEIARFVGRSKYFVESRLLCITWPPDIRDAVRNDKIGLGVAAALADIHDDAERRRLLAYATEQGCNARTARAWADTYLSTEAAVPAAEIQNHIGQNPLVYEEPLFPCYGCERPVKVGQLQIIRLCGDCKNDISNPNPRPAVNDSNNTSSNGQIAQRGYGA